MEGKGTNLNILCQASKWYLEIPRPEKLVFAYFLMPLQRFSTLLYLSLLLPRSLS